MSAPVDVLAVVEKVIEHTYNPFEPDNQSPIYEKLIATRSAVAELIELRDQVARIADDYYPDRDADAPCALSEMREALNEALARVDGAA